MLNFRSDIAFEEFGASEIKLLKAQAQELCAGSKWALLGMLLLHSDVWINWKLFSFLQISK
jgi:hypothetical protein